MIKFNAKNRKNRSFSWTREGGVAYLQKTLCRSLSPFFLCLWGSFSLHSPPFQHWLLLYFRGLSGSQSRVLGFFWFFHWRRTIDQLIKIWNKKICTFQNMPRVIKFSKDKKTVILKLILKIFFDKISFFSFE